MSAPTVYTFSTCEASEYDTQLRLYSGDHLQAGSAEIAINDDACNLQSVITETLSPGDYTLVVEGFSDRNAGMYTLVTSCTPVPTAVLTCPSHTWVGTTAGAEPGGTSPSGHNWFELSVPVARSYRFSTCNTAAFDTVLHIFLGSHLAEDATIVATNDDNNASGCTGFTSQLDVTLEPGEYTLVVEGFGSAEGSFTLTTTCGAPVSSGELFCDTQVTGDTTNSINVVGEDSGEHFYDLTVLSTEAGVYTFSTCEGSSYDTRLRLYMGSHLAAESVELANNDDACGLQSEITMELEPGSYTVVVEGFRNDEGSYTLATVCNGGEPTPAPTPDSTTASPTPGPTDDPTELTCAAHTDCGEGTYCDAATNCFNCSYCINTNNDAIDGACPSTCFPDSCTNHAACGTTGGRYCDTAENCFNCSYCVNNNNDAIDGACPEHCYAFTTPAVPTATPTNTPTPAPTGSPTYGGMLRVTSGSQYCQATAINCVTDGAGNYGNDERCTFEIAQAGFLTATEFDTESGGDTFIINSTSTSAYRTLYSGKDGPSNVAVTAETVVAWSSNFDDQRAGWTICWTAVAVPTAAPTLTPTLTRPPTSTPPPTPVAQCTGSLYSRDHTQITLHPGDCPCNIVDIEAAGRYCLNGEDYVIEGTPFRATSSLGGGFSTTATQPMYGIEPGTHSVQLGTCANPAASATAADCAMQSPTATPTQPPIPGPTTLPSGVPTARSPTASEPAPVSEPPTTLQPTALPTASPTGTELADGSSADAGGPNRTEVIIPIIAGSALLALLVCVGTVYITRKQRARRNAPRARPKPVAHVHNPLYTNPVGRPGLGDIVSATHASQPGADAPPGNSNRSGKGSMAPARPVYATIDDDGDDDGDTTPRTDYRATPDHGDRPVYAVADSNHDPNTYAEISETYAIDKEAARRGGGGSGATLPPRQHHPPAGEMMYAVANKTALKAQAADDDATYSTSLAQDNPALATSEGTYDMPLGDAVAPTAHYDIASQGAQGGTSEGTYDMPLGNAVSAVEQTNHYDMPLASQLADGGGGNYDIPLAGESDDVGSHYATPFTVAAASLGDDGTYDMPLAGVVGDDSSV